MLLSLRQKSTRVLEITSYACFGVLTGDKTFMMYGNEIRK